MSLISQIIEEERATARQGEQLPVSGAVLAVDIGSIYTRAVLLDVVDGMYRFVARGETPSTGREPWNDVLEGVYQVIQQITAATGRALLDESGELIMPEESNFSGVSTFVATSSGGKPIRAVLAGLVKDVSLRSGRRAADSTYLSLVDTFSLDDRRGTDQRIDALLNAEADLLLIVGGTDGGALDLMRRQLDTILLTFSLMDNISRPTVLYAGNRDLVDEFMEKADEVGMKLLVADNVRPTLDIEYLDSAQAQLASLYHQQRARSTPGFGEIDRWTGGGVFPTAHAFSRMVHLLGSLYDQSVLGIDMGSASTTVAASINQECYLNVFGQLGMGHAAKDIFNYIRPESLIRWLTFELESPDDVMDYVWNKSVYPHTIPARMQELEIEYAMAREIVRSAALNARQSWRNVRQRGLLPHFDTIILSGSTLTRTPHFGWSVLLALDGLLPVGMTRLLLDPYGITAALGVTAPINPQAVVQVLETGAFVDLGTVISISGRARRGEIVLRGSLRPRDEVKSRPFEVRYGTIATIPLQYGEEAELTLHMRRGEIEGLRKRRITITGGALGLIVDARGRPWRFPRAEEQRRALVREWQQSITQER